MHVGAGLVPARHGHPQGGPPTADKFLVWKKKGNMKRDILLFVLGIAIGYCLVHGLKYAHQHYLWALFYH